MFLIYRWLGASPEILGSKGEGKDKISAGLWSHAAQSWDKTRRKACIDEKTSREWVMNDEVSARSLMIA
jgi:acyl homoserine lactone synthase